MNTAPLETAAATDYDGSESVTVADATRNIKLWIELGEQGDSVDQQCAADVKEFVAKHTLAKAVIAYRAAWHVVHADEYDLDSEDSE